MRQEKLEYQNLDLRETIGDVAERLWALQAAVQAVIDRHDVLPAELEELADALERSRETRFEEEQ
jgi:hypothetical protein